MCMSPHASHCRATPNLSSRGPMPISQPCTENPQDSLALRGNRAFYRGRRRDPLAYRFTNLIYRWAYIKLRSKDLFSRHVIKSTMHNGPCTDTEPSSESTNMNGPSNAASVHGFLLPLGCKQHVEAKTYFKLGFNSQRTSIRSQNVENRQYIQLPLNC
jgi:hypothetical protein